MAISGKTKAALIRAVASQDNSEISLLAIEVGLEGRAEGRNRRERCMSLVRAIETDFEPHDALKLLLELAEQRLKSYSEWEFERNNDAVALRRALELDGYAFDGQRLLPAVPGAVTLEQEISLLEASLCNLGLNVALTHYQQAVENFVRNNSEAANGQVRPFLEDIFLTLCHQQTGRQFKDASAALQHLRNTGWLDDGEWNHLRQFWADIQDNGPHRCLSDADEALFRLQVATAIARSSRGSSRHERGPVGRFSVGISCPWRGETTRYHFSASEGVFGARQRGPTRRRCGAAIPPRCGRPLDAEDTRFPGGQGQSVAHPPNECLHCRVAGRSPMHIRSRRPRPRRRPLFNPHPSRARRRASRSPPHPGRMEGRGRGRRALYTRCYSATCRTRGARSIAQGAAVDRETVTNFVRAGQRPFKGRVTIL